MIAILIVTKKEDKYSHKKKKHGRLAVPFQIATTMV